MKKTSLIAAVCALALALPSCDKTKGRGDGTVSENIEIEGGEAEVEAVYDDEAYDIDDAIDPNDEEAYARYGAQYEEDEPDVPTGPSDVDMVDVQLTTSAEVGMLLDQFDYDINRLAELMTDQQGNADAIEYLCNHIIKITDKMNDAAEAGICTDELYKRYERQAARFLEIANSDK